MTGHHWSERISPRNSPQDLRDIRAAAREFANEAQRLPGGSGVVFRHVSDCVILASVVATASLAIFHLWKELHRSHERSERSALNTGRR